MISGMTTNHGGAITPQGASHAGTGGHTATQTVFTAAANLRGAIIRFAKIHVRGVAADQVSLRNTTDGIIINRAYDGSDMEVRDIEFPAGKELTVTVENGTPTFDWGVNYDLL